MKKYFAITLLVTSFGINAFSINEPITNSGINYYGIAENDPGNGKYYSTQPGVKYVEISNCCDASTLQYKPSDNSGSAEVTYKKSAYVNDLFFNPRNNDFLYIYREKNVILDFTAQRLAGQKSHTIKAVDILSMDEKDKSLARDTYKSKVVEVLAEQAQKKDADEAQEEKKRIAERVAPVDLMKKPELTKAALDCINNQAAKDNYGYSFSKAYIISADWLIYKNEYTGAILKRTVDVAVVHMKDGKCFLESFSVGQDYAGGGNYQKTVFFDGVLMKSGLANDEIDCSKIK